MKPIVSAFFAMQIAWLGFGVAAMGQTIKVGVVAPLSGRYAAIGNELKHGYDIAVEKINAGGGVQVGNRRLLLELIVLDDESDATKTVARLETHAAQGVVAYLGGVGSDLHAAGATVAEKNRIPYLGVGFALESIHKQGYRYLFSPFWKSPQIARETYRLLNGSLAENQRPKKVALFLEKTDWGQEIGGYWESFGKEAGYEVVVKGEYAPGAKDFSNVILQAKSAGAESVLGVPSPPDGMTLVKQMKELDFTPKFLMLLRGSDSPAWTNNLGAAGDYTILGTGWHAALKYPQVKELNDTYMQQTQPAGRPRRRSRLRRRADPCRCADESQGGGPRRAAPSTGEYEYDDGVGPLALPRGWNSRDFRRIYSVAKGETTSHLAQRKRHRTLCLSGAAFQPALGHILTSTAETHLRS